MQNVPPMPSHVCNDPMELLLLKRQLASLNCSCNVCDTTGPVTCKRVVEHRDQDVQVQYDKRVFDQSIQATTDNTTLAEKIQSSYGLLNTMSKDFCSSCAHTLNLLRGGLTKVLKDEESEANTSMFACDKSVENVVLCIEKTTSQTKPLQKSPALIDFSEQAMLIPSDSSLSSQRHRKPSREVTFLLGYNDFVDENSESRSDLSEQEPQPNPVLFELGVLPIEDYINSIRPPMNP